MHINEYNYRLDNMLSVANQEPIDDAAVQRYYRSGVSPENAYSMIISIRNRANWLDTQATRG